MRKYRGPLLPTCRCGKVTKMITSWTDRNPGRRYAVCSEEVGGCGYWNWIDDEMCRRSIELIPGLLRRINATEKQKDEFETAAARSEAKAAKLKAKLRETEKQLRWQKWLNKFLVRVFVVSWLVAVIMVLTEKKIAGGVSLGMLQIGNKCNGIMQIEDDT